MAHAWGPAIADQQLTLPIVSTMTWAWIVIKSKARGLWIDIDK